MVVVCNPPFSRKGAFLKKYGVYDGVWLLQRNAISSHLLLFHSVESLPTAEYRNGTASAYVRAFIGTLRHSFGVLPTRTCKELFNFPYEVLGDRVSRSPDRTEGVLNVKLKYYPTARLQYLKDATYFDARLKDRQLSIEHGPSLTQAPYDVDADLSELGIVKIIDRFAQCLEVVSGLNLYFNPPRWCFQ